MAQLPPDIFIRHDGKVIKRVGEPCWCGSACNGPVLEIIDVKDVNVGDSLWSEINKQWLTCK